VTIPQATRKHEPVAEEGDELDGDMREGTLRYEWAARVILLGGLVTAIRDFGQSGL
jgi:hypothetical protein